MIVDPGVRAVAKSEVYRVLVPIAADCFDVEFGVRKAPYPVLDLPFVNLSPIILRMLTVRRWRHAEPQIIPGAVKVTDNLQEQRSGRHAVALREPVNENAIVFGLTEKVPETRIHPTDHRIRQ